MFKYLTKKDGFTIIELLVVVAIIGMLSSLILLQIQEARAKARDVQREQDIKNIQSSMALYVVNNQTYPVTNAIALDGTDPVSQELINKESMPKIPLDPFNRDNYVYTYASADGSTYTLTYYLETDTVPGKSAGQQIATP